MHNTINFVYIRRLEKKNLDSAISPFYEVEVHNNGNTVVRKTLSELLAFVNIVVYAPQVMERNDLNILLTETQKYTNQVVYIPINNKNYLSCVNLIANWDFDQKYKILLSEEIRTNKKTITEREDSITNNKVVFIVTNADIIVENNNVRLATENEIEEKSLNKVFIKSVCDSYREQVSNSELMKSMNGLKIYFDQNNSHVDRDDIVMLKASLSRLETLSDSDRIDFNTYHTNLNKIAYSLLYIIREKI